MQQALTLPKSARLPINRCNLPADILGSLTFQNHPVRLYIDGVQNLHRRLFQQLTQIQRATVRANAFKDYMTVHFRLHHLEDAGLDEHRKQHRPNADYIRTLRGWFFNPNGREAAALKGWVESRFGLLTRYHDGQVYDPLSENYLKFLDARSNALYCTNALEAQLDLLYSFCQFELALKYAESQRLKLYRGIIGPDQHEILARQTKHDITILLNNLNSFTSVQERADEFGDYCLEVLVPWQKIVFYSSLIPEMLNGENEYLVIGGIYNTICA